jgi:hypothetical protein
MCPRMTRISAHDFLSPGLFRVYSRHSRADLFVLSHSDCAHNNLIRRPPEPVLIFMPESSYPCYPRNPWFQMFCSLGIGIWTF